jgi:FkbM family methyltransferase
VSVVTAILGLPELREAPPVLVDVGASQALHPKWRRIARFSICVAFEPDDRAASHLTSSSAGFRALHTYNAIVVEDAKASGRFHLTASPYCSSRLEPKPGRLQDYAFAGLFRVERTVELKTIDLSSALTELGIDRVDWFKTDSQGTDLRLFQSLPEEIRSRVLVAEFEPGIIDAYEGEDKLADLLAYMDRLSFWPSGLEVRGSVRGRPDVIADRLSPRALGYLDACAKTAPGWAELEYFNDFADGARFGRRELLLGSLFALVRGHEAFALELARRGRARFGEEGFERLEHAAVSRLRRRLLRLPLLAAGVVARRALRR